VCPRNPAYAPTVGQHPANTPDTPNTPEHPANTPDTPTAAAPIHQQQVVGLKAFAPQQLQVCALNHHKGWRHRGWPALEAQDQQPHLHTVSLDTAYLSDAWKF